MLNTNSFCEITFFNQCTPHSLVLTFKDLDPTINSAGMSLTSYAGNRGWGGIVCLVMILNGLYCFQRLKIFTKTFIREYFRLQDRIKH